MVLMKADPAGRAHAYKSHALDCRWVAGGKVGEYVEVPASSLHPGVGKCAHCGGGDR